MCLFSSEFGCSNVVESVLDVRTKSWIVRELANLWQDCLQIEVAPKQRDFSQCNQGR